MGNRREPMSNFKTLNDADVKGKRVLLRVDLNVPTENGQVTDATRIERIAPTITEIADKGGKVILLAHFGRPKGPDPKDSLQPIAAAVSHIVKRPVGFAEDCIGEKAEAAVAAMKPGDICCWRTPASTRARKRTTRRSSPNSPNSATSGSTTPFRRRTGRMLRPRGLATSSRPMPAAPCRPSWRRWRKRWTHRRSPSSPSSAAPRSRPSLSFWKISSPGSRRWSSAAPWPTPSCTPRALRSANRWSKRTWRTPPAASSTRPKAGAAPSSCRSTPSSRSTSRPIRPPMPMAWMRSRLRA